LFRSKRLGTRPVGQPPEGPAPGVPGWRFCWVPGRVDPGINSSTFFCVWEGSQRLMIQWYFQLNVLSFLVRVFLVAAVCLYHDLLVA